MTTRDLPYVLRMEDRNSMFNNIEARVPFLDNDLVSQFENDILNVNEKRAEFWFRFYTLGRWIELKVNN